MNKLHSTETMVFLMEVLCVLCDIRTESLYIMQIHISFYDFNESIGLGTWNLVGKFIIRRLFLHAILSITNCKHEIEDKF